MGAECTIVVCVIIISLKFSYTTLFVTLFCFQWRFKFLFFFSNFSFFHETHTLALNRIGELGDIFQSVPT